MEQVRSIVSKQEFRERRRKKMGVLPFSMFLSFNDRDVHPRCPHASNPYHKCARHCIEKIPSGKNLLDEEILGNVKDGEKMAERRGVNSSCPNASNPYHKCADYCFQKIPQEKGKEQETTKGVPVITEESGVRPNCKYASNPYHKCAEYCYVNTPYKEQPDRVMKPMVETKAVITGERGIYSKCKNASDPYHVCVEYCFQHIPNKDSPGKAMKLKYSKQRLNDVSIKDITAFMKPKEGKKDISPTEGEEILECMKSEDPYHLSAEYNFQNVLERDYPRKVMKPKEEKQAIVALERDQPGKLMKQKEEREAAVALERGDQPEQVHKLRSTERENRFGHKNITVTKPIAEKTAVVDERGVNPKCRNASNPYHVCAEYCFQFVPETNQPKRVMELKDSKKRESMISNWEMRVMKREEEKKVLVTPQMVANPECKNASNPYHVCAEYCFKSIIQKDQLREVLRLKSLQPRRKSSSNREMMIVNPQCEYASNPYHDCAKHCFHNTPEREKNLLKGALSKGQKMTNAESRHVDPKCKDASNPYHKCSGYCLQVATGKNHIMEGNPVLAEDSTMNSTKEKMNDHLVVEKNNMDTKCKTDSNKEKKNGHPVVERSSMDTKCVEASKSNDNHEKSSEEITTLDESKKSSMNSKSMKEQKLDHSHTLFSEGITHDGTEVLEREENKEVDTTELSGVQPLSSDASDLLHEWAIYCSQKKAAKDDLVKQYKTGEEIGFPGRNGNENVIKRSFGSSTFEEVQAKRHLPSSLPSSVLYLLGVLLAMFYWAQLIHSMVISSDRSKAIERITHKSRVNPKCRNVSDPYHKCSECCWLHEELQ